MESRLLAGRLLRGLARPSSSSCGRISSVHRRNPIRLKCLSVDSQLFSTNASDENKDKSTKTKDEEESINESLQDTVNRLRGEGASGKNAGSDFARTAAGLWSKVRDEVGSTWQELIQSGERKSINKKIHPVATAEGDKPYTGPVDIMVIDPSEHLTAWERMQRRLSEAPIIQEMLSRTDEIYEKSGARKAKERLDEIKEDAREAWETSQNPWVYRVSSVYDTLTAESAETMAVKQLRELDPTFTLDDWRRDVTEHTLPQIMEWFLEGKINQLKDWFGESVFTRVAAEITARNKEGVQIDTHVLAIMNSEILSVEPDHLEKGSPIILMYFMVQQINCVRKKDDGTIVEGAEDDIKANTYIAAFQREYREEEGELIWKIIDFRLNDVAAYL